MSRISKEKKNQPEEPLEKKLWKAADKLRKNMDAAEYKHIVLGLIFLKYISDAFEELYRSSRKAKENMKAQTQKTRMNTRLKRSSMFRPRHDGICFSEGQNSRPLAKIWMTRWTPLKKIIPLLKAFCRKFMPRRTSIRQALAVLSTS